MAEEEEERIDSEQLKDDSKPSFAPTVNIISHYTLPIDYPESPSDDDDDPDDPDERVETSISSETEVHDNQIKLSSLSSEECHSPKDCSAIPSSSNNELTLLQATAVANKEEAPGSEIQDTDNDSRGGAGSQSVPCMIKSTDISVVYCHSTTVITTVSTETHYSQALEPLSSSPPSSSSFSISSLVETKGSGPSTLNKPSIHDADPTISNDDTTIAPSITDVSDNHRVSEDEPSAAIDAGSVVETGKGSFGDSEETTYPEVTEGDNWSEEHQADYIGDAIEEEVKLDGSNEGLGMITDPPVIDQDNDIVETAEDNGDTGVEDRNEEPMEVVNEERQELVSATDKNDGQSLSRDIDQTKDISTDKRNAELPIETSEVRAEESFSQTETESSPVSNIVAPKVMVTEEKEDPCEATIEHLSESTTTEATGMTGSFNKAVHSPPEEASEDIAHVEKDSDTSLRETDVKDVSVQEEEEKEEVLKMEVVPCIKESEIKCCREELHESENEVTEGTNLQDEAMECSTELLDKEDEIERNSLSMVTDPQEEMKEEQQLPITKDNMDESSSTAVSEEEAISKEEHVDERVAIITKEIANDDDEQETEAEETEQSVSETDVSLTEDSVVTEDDNEEEEGKQVLDPPITGSSAASDNNVQEEMNNDATTSVPSTIQDNDTEHEIVTLRIEEEEEITSDAVVEAESEKEEVELVANVISKSAGDVPPVSNANKLIDISSTNIHHTPSPRDGAPDSSDTETEAKLVPESGSQTVLSPCPVVLPSLSSDSLTLSSSSSNVVSSISSLFSTLPPFSSICASPISLSSTQSPPLPPHSVSSSSSLPLTFGSYHKTVPHHVSVLTSHPSLPSSVVSPPLSSSLTTPPEDNSQVTTPQVLVNMDSVTISSAASNEDSSSQTSSSLSSFSPSHTAAIISTEASVSTAPVVSMAAPPEGSSWPMKGIKVEEKEWSDTGEPPGLGVNDVTSQQLKLAQQKLAMLQRHSFSPLYKPTDVSSLERVGSDSQNNVFWYDGGRNLYQSPPIWDSFAKPKESELVLVCKSFIQWQNKLKQLRSSCHEPDSKLAQTIKQMYLSRVKIATKRKTKDPAAVSTHRQRNISPLTTSSIAAQNMASAAIQQASGLASLQVPQGLPQGSILVVPSSNMLQGGGGTGRFPGVPLLLANTALIVPQNIETQSPLSSSQFTASRMISYESPHHNLSIRESPDITPSNKSHNTKKNESDSDEEEVVIQRIEAPKNLYQPYAAVSVATNPTQPKHLFFPPVQLMKEGEEPVKKTQPQLFFTPPQSSKESPFSASGVEILKVEPEAEMGLIDKNTKSLEILEEVPIRKVSLDSSFTAHEGTLVYQSFSQQQKDPLVASGQTNHNKVPPTSSSQIRLPFVSIATGPAPSTTYSHTMSESNAIVALTELATKGRTTQEVMSAKTLLSLHGPGGQPLLPSVPLAPPTSGVLSRPKKTPRKQKPVASARSIVPPGNQGNPPPPSFVAPNVNKTHSSSPAAPDAKPKRKEYTPEELLKILEIPSKPNQFEEPSSSTGNNKKPDPVGTQDPKVSSPVKPVESFRKETPQHYRVPDKELLASVQKGGELRKEPPVIRPEGPESESDSSESSSETESSSEDERKDKVKKPSVNSAARQTQPLLSSRVMSQAGAQSSSSSSSSDSSSSSTDDSSDDEEAPVVHSKSVKGKKGGAVKRRAPVKRQKATSRSVKDLSRSVSRPVKPQKQKAAKKPQKPSAPVESKKQQKATTVKRLQKKKPLPVVKSQASTKKGRAQRPPARQKKVPSLIVSILRRHLEAAKKIERKRKQIQEPDTENESDDSSSTDSPPPSPGKSSGKKDGSGPAPDLKKYFNPNHVDLKTLSELTQSVEPGKDEGSRSKRTCVRVREEIAKLNELLDANGEKIKIPAGTPNRTGGGGGVSKGQTKGGKRRRSSQGTTSKKKKIKTTSVKEGSQFKSSTKSSNNASDMKPKYVFSTQLANQAAEAVWRGKFESVISFHKSQQQVKDSKMLRLPSKESLGGSRSMWDTNGRLNLRPRSSISKSSNNSNNNRGKRSVRNLGGNQGELRRSKRLAKTKGDSEDEDESEDEEEEEEEEEEEDEQEEEEEQKDDNKKDKSKLARSSVKRRRSPLVPDDISTPSSDDVTSSASEGNEEQEEEEEEEKEEKRDLEEEVPNSQPPPPNGSPKSVKSQHMTPPQPLPSEHMDSSHVAPSNQTPLHTPAGTPNQPPSKEEVNYTICHGTPETRLSSADIEHTSRVTLSHSRPQLPIVTKHGSGVMATSGNISSGHMTWSGGFPHSQLPGPYSQLYKPPGAVYSHQPYPYQVTYPWPHPPEHMEHSHPLSITPAAWPTPPPTTYHQTKDAGNKTSSSSLSSRSHYYSSTGKHSSSSSHHHLASATPTHPHFPFPQPGGGGGASVNPQYSFESHHPSLAAAAAHVWPSHQLPHPQLHPLMPAAAHTTHLTPQGIPWSPYSRHLQGPVGHHHHLNIGQQDRISVIDKSKAKEGKSGESKINSNSNNNNNNNNKNKKTNRFLSSWYPPTR